MMNMLIDFKVNHKLTFTSCTLIGALFANPLPILAAAIDVTTRHQPISRQFADPPSSFDNLDSLSPTASRLLTGVRKEDAKKLIYINAIGLSDGTRSLSLAQIKKKVFHDDMRYLIDFTDISDREMKVKAENQLRTLLGVSVPSEMLMIGQYKGELIYTPISNGNSALLKKALTRKSQPSVSISHRRQPAPANSPATMAPHVAFYLEVERPISKQECTFPVSPIWNRGETAFCDQANISLTYRVNLMRSLSQGIVGSATPDAKLVRISLDADSAGAGIFINEKLNINTQRLGVGAESPRLDDWGRTYTTSAIAKDYKFSISASNKTASILKTYPANNENKDMTERVTSGFEIGIGGGPEVGPGGPKAKLEASASYSQARMLIFHKSDYRIVRTAPNGQTISFMWERETTPTADSLLSKRTGAIWADSHPFNLGAIHPISYQGFTPNFDVIYKAAPNASGLTTFNIESSVNLWPVSTAAYYHYYVFGTHLSFQGQEHWQKYRRVSIAKPLVVDWDHPVFTGGRPVNLQLGGFNDKCISYGDQAKVEIASCELDSRAQSFIYDQYGRYMSAINTGKCLDINNLQSFQTCDAKLSQRWKWIDHSDQLQNEFQGKYLAHEGENLVAASDTEKSDNLRIITKFTDIFSQ